MRRDQIVARVLDLGGTVEVVLPAAEFDDLISRATSVHTMPAVTSNREAYQPRAHTP